MIDIAEWLTIDPYSFDAQTKSVRLAEALTELTALHRNACPPYARMLDALSYDEAQVQTPADVPFLPVRLFKQMDLLSIDRADVVKTMTSSGTSGQQVSRIFLDKSTASAQTKVLTRLVSTMTGAQRMPMLVIDSPSVVRDRAMFSARGAGILGFSIFARERVFALDDEMRLDIEAVRAFLDRHAGQRVLVFGFTFMVWQYLYQELARTGAHLDLSQAVLIHGGGWKKLASEQVSSQIFRERLREVTGIEHVHDYYGMVEQTGSIYIECESGHLHTSIFSDVIVRRLPDLSPCAFGEEGIIEVVSVLPTSYPGHALLTEDRGIILGEDDCSCGRLGRYFQVLGRLKDAEIRGCSDTFAAEAPRLEHAG